MKAMIATLVFVFSCQVMANSFDNFGQTGNQTADVQNIIIKTKNNVSLEGLGFNRAVMTKTPIIKSMKLHLLQLNPLLNVEQVLSELRRHPDVVYAQLDHKVTPRNTEGPNDPSFGQQWSMELSDNNFGIDALSAWMTYGTGGKDAFNNDIVVAVVDGGIEISHPDLRDNIWVNQGEIPGNQIDDDGNGYVDDINGWNGYTNTGAPKSNSHGTHVAGIVGARGNNTTGVAGVNWDVKIMNVPGSSGSTSVVLTAYNYVLEQKKLWLATNGAKGANIVSTNSSFGIDYADCKSGSYPAWNDVYTEMGKVGILSAAATANNSINVDVRGDVPTGCDSPYIVAVTNNRPNGMRDQAAYGKISVDLAAPGSQIYSTYTGGGYASLTGTSMATPHVAGAIAFLNSIASPTLAELYISNPGEAALEMKRIMLETVTKRGNFAEETVSGGILNLNAAAHAVVNYGMGN